MVIKKILWSFFSEEKITLCLFFQPHIYIFFYPYTHFFLSYTHFFSFLPYIYIYIYTIFLTYTQFFFPHTLFIHSSNNFIEEEELQVVKHPKFQKC